MTQLSGNKAIPAVKPVAKTTTAAKPAPAAVPAAQVLTQPSVPLVVAPQADANNPFIARNLDFSVDWLSMLVYGDFGVGKTYFCGTALLVEDYRDILYISLEGGEKGLKQLVRDAKAKGIDANKHILVIPVQTFKQYGNIYEFLKLHVKFRDANDIVNLRKLEAQIRGYGPDIINNPEKLLAAVPEPMKFRTVITDSLTEAQKYCMYQLLGIDPLKQKIDQEPDSAQYQDWGRSREMIGFLVRRLRDLPINSLFICGQDIDQDVTKAYHYNPLLPGKLAGDVRGFVSCVGYYMAVPLEQGNITRRMYFVGGKYGQVNLAAKHRFGSNLKSSYIDNPTMETIFNLDNM